jgi:hypothetical protein
MTLTSFVIIASLTVSWNLVTSDVETSSEIKGMPYSHSTDGHRNSIRGQESSEKSAKLLTPGSISRIAPIVGMGKLIFLKTYFLKSVIGKVKNSIGGSPGISPGGSGYQPPIITSVTPPFSQTPVGQIPSGQTPVGQIPATGGQQPPTFSRQRSRKLHE